MILTYGQLELALSLYMGIHPDRVGTFRARIKQFQRLQFPSGVNVGRGVKMTYSGEHLFKVATALQLISLGQPAMTAANIVESNWEDFATGYGIAIRNEFFDWPIQKRSAGISIYFRIVVNSLAPLMGEDDAYLSNGWVSVAHKGILLDAIDDDPERVADSAILLSASNIMRGILYSCLKAKVDDPLTNPEFSDWHTRSSSNGWWNYGEISEYMNVPND